MHFYSYIILTQLAQYDNEKAGLFYDESFLKEVAMKLNISVELKVSSKSSFSLNKFTGFEIWVRRYRKIIVMGKE